MRILLTGAGGMVGRNLLASPGFQDFEMLAPLRSELDLMDAVSLRSYLDRTKPEMVIHCAGKVGGIEANRLANGTFLLENALLGINVIAASKACGIPKLINLASSCMYPKDREGCLRVEDLLTGPLEPTNEGYAIAKILAWKLTQFISAEQCEFSYKTLIPCNLYGPWDKFDPLNAHLIPSIIRKAHEAKLQGGPIEIWGDGSARREFMFAEDLARFICHAISHWDDCPSTLNVGYGSDYSVLDYYRIVCEVLGFQPEFYFNLDKPSGMKRKLMDSQAACSMGWQPFISHAEGIDRTYRFFMEQHK